MINNNWVFGQNCGLDFSTSPPTAFSGSSISTIEGCATISDVNGALLFYTDGRTIWDNTHTIKATGLLGNSSSTQSAIIVPDPGNNSQYYVFTADGATGSSNHFNGGLINVNTWVFTPLAGLMTLPSTSGFSPVEKITAIQHENCKDFWIITILQKGVVRTMAGDGIVRIFLVDSLGVQFISDTPLDQQIIDIGYMKASPDGLKLAIANYSNNNILVYPFNKTTGVVNLGGLLTINTSSPNYGVEFSPNSKLLYYSKFSGSSPIYQVDLTGSLTPTVVGNINSTSGALQLGRDNKIYIAKHNQNSLAAILNPNIIGAGCSVNSSYVVLSSNSKSYIGLPNLIAGFCNEDCDCGCVGCNEDSEKQNEELIVRAKDKFNTITSHADCPEPFMEICKEHAIVSQLNLEPCFSFHWGDGSNDQIEEHDTEVFYLTVCNNFNDITYNGLRITKVVLSPTIHPLEKIQIVPDRFISLDCLKPCTCQTREFVMITRANDTAGSYTLEVEYCYEEIVISSSANSGLVKFPVTITED
ncbi:MAG: hypothetical protein COB98_09560 [Flavobacteriaceae bacterium]|nr:MAG: hypothetical protein COB98_09560 [Flavobacteriaceae bacterium]